MASIIKTDNIQKVSDDSNIIKKCGSTTTVGSGAGNTITVDGATVTLGRCGGTVSLASGATQTGFGQEYSAANFCTTAKTSPFTATADKGFFVNTTSGAITVTLPASPSAGDVVALKDYANTWASNNVTVCRNSSKINGTCSNVTLDTSSQSITLIYADATKGWLSIYNSNEYLNQPDFITASGGTVTTCGDYKIHTFTADGCFAVTTGGVPGNNIVSYLVVAGGGGAGNQQRGGGGAGGFREAKVPSDPYTDSPLDAGTGLTVSSQTYPISVGGGGAAGTPASPCGNTNGSPSVFSTITSTGGGTGGSGMAQPGGPYPGGGPGGSGGGAGENQTAPGSNGNQPPVSPAQGNPGGSGNIGGPNQGSAAGGGGAGASGGNISSKSPNSKGGDGGAGVSTSISGSSLSYAGGGGGGGYPTASQPGGNASPCGTGGAGGTFPAGNGGSGTTNRGGGGGSGAGSPGSGGTGGSGVVIIRYKYQ